MLGFDYGKRSTWDTPVYQEKEGFSLPAQKELIEEYARSKGLYLADIFTESETAKKAGRLLLTSCFVILTRTRMLQG